MTLSVEITRQIPAPPERVYDAWLDPGLMARFLRPGPGVRVRDVEVNPVVGGAFSLVMLAGEVAIPIGGTYRELDRPKALAFSWLSSRTRADSLVRLTFTAVPGGTEMTLRHTGFPDASSRNDHDGGWVAIVDALAAQLRV